MASVRKTVKDALIAALSGITVAQGYRNTITTINPVFRSVEQAGAFPSLAIVDGEQSIRPVAEDGSLYEGEISFGVIGCVKVDSDEALSEACDWLIDDVRTALLNGTGPILAGLNGGSLQVLADEILPDEAGGIGYIAVFLTIRFVQ